MRVSSIEVHRSGASPAMTGILKIDVYRPDSQPVAFGERGLRNALVIDENTVAATQIKDFHVVIFDFDFGVIPRDGGIF